MHVSYIPEYLPISLRSKTQELILLFVLRTIEILNIIRSTQI